MSRPRYVVVSFASPRHRLPPRPTGRPSPNTLTMHADDSACVSRSDPSRLHPSLLSPFIFALFSLRSVLSAHALSVSRCLASPAQVCDTHACISAPRAFAHPPSSAHTFAVYYTVFEDVAPPYFTCYTARAPWHNGYRCSTSDCPCTYAALRGGDSSASSTRQPRFWSCLQSAARTYSRPRLSRTLACATTVLSHRSKQ